MPKKERVCKSLLWMWDLRANSGRSPLLAGNFELLFSKHATFKGEQESNGVQHTGEHHVLSTMEKSISLCSPNKIRNK